MKEDELADMPLSPTTHRSATDRLTLCPFLRKRATDGPTLDVGSVRCFRSSDLLASPSTSFYIVLGIEALLGLMMPAIPLRTLDTSHPTSAAEMITSVEPLFPAAYEELRTLAERHLRSERRGHTLTPTALIHEAYLKMKPQTRAVFTDRRHFLLVAAQAMRRILANYARERSAQKRGGGAERLTLQPYHATSGEDAIDVLALDSALARLGAFDPRKQQIVELRYFAGLTPEETAETLGISRATFYREWAAAKAWLYSYLHETD